MTTRLVEQGSRTMLKTIAMLRFLLIIVLSSFRASSGFYHTVLPTTTRKCPQTTRLFVDGQGMAGGPISKHLLGDIFRSLQPKYLGRVAEAVKSNMKGLKNITVEISSLEDAMEMPQWEDICRELENQQTTEERTFREDLVSGHGTTPNALASRRLFDRDTEPKVKLYRDSAAWCPYCQKVWIALEEKRVSYEVIKVDMNCYGNGKPSEFLELQPNGNLPCAIIGGEVIGESNDIVDALDAIGAEGTPTLRPLSQEEMIQELCDNGRNSLERRLFSEWMWYLTGVRKPEEYRERFDAILDEVESALAKSNTDGPYFLGKDLSLVDIRFIPFVERQLASLAYFKGYNGRDVTRRPNLVRWLEAMESRPSYQATKSDYYTHSRALPPQLASECASYPGSEEMQAAIDSLPVGDGSNDWVEPGWDWAKNDGAARREAVERLTHRHEAIVKFCARGAGMAGVPPVSATLADPSATPNDSAMPAIDWALRHVSQSLLEVNVDVKKKKEDQFQKAVASIALDEDSANSIASCVDYLRSRIGVPRDMSYPAATVLRAELLRVSNVFRQANPKRTPAVYEPEAPKVVA